MTNDPYIPELPEAEEEESEAQTALDRMRKCPNCGCETRISSNYLGVVAHCGPCKQSWPVAVAQVRDPRVSNLPGRGMQKQVLAGAEDLQDYSSPPRPEEPERKKKRRK